MGGKRLKTRLKESKKLIKTEVKARYDAINEWFKKNPGAWFSERLADLAKNSTVADVGFVIAWISVAYILHESVDFMKGVVLKLPKILPPGLRQGLDAIWNLVSPTPFTFSEMMEMAERYEKEKGYPLTTQIIEWLICFGVAWIIVKHFGEIMHTAGNITSSVTSLGLKLIG